MPLLDLKTDLKSLKYGQDRPGGGDSGQPYIKTDINTVDSGFNRLRLTKFDDGLVRGGVIGALNASVVDTLRISKFLYTDIKGPLFIVKQIGLQLSNPRLESKQVRTDRATSGGGFFNNAINFVANVAGKIENAVGPTRIYNLGINTLAQVPINAIGGHIVRHGFLPVRDENKDYINVVKENNFVNGTNRLTKLTDKFYLGRQAVVQQRTQVTNAALAALGAITSPILGVAAGLAINKSQFSIDNYIGGPDSTYGLVSTSIRRFDYTQDTAKIDFAISQSKDFAGYTRDDKNQPAIVKIKNTVDYKISSITGSSFATSSFNLSSTQLDNSFIYNVASDKDKQHARNSTLPKIENTNDLAPQGPSSYPSSSGVTGLNSLSLPNLVYSSGSTSSSYANIETATNQLTAPNNIGIYATILNANQLSANSNGVLPKSTFKPTYTNGYGNVVKVNQPWNKVTRELRVGKGRQDPINLTPIFRSKPGTHDDTVKINGTTYNINDLVKFRIQAVNTDKPDEIAGWMIFRAYLTDLSDSVDATWNPVKYAGRGDQFYIYDGFTRKMSVSFKVAALSLEEMAPMYQKLNFLM